MSKKPTRIRHIDRRSFLKGRAMWLKGLLDGNIHIRGIVIPRVILVGILGVVLMYVSVAAIVSVTTPWSFSSDTKQHVDYVWRLYNGEIPRRTDGLQYPPFVEEYNNHYKPQAASANPPLFYAIQAPLMGPLLNEGEWEKAILLGRSVNIVIGILCILALAWAGWVFGGRRRLKFAICVPALAVLMHKFTNLNMYFALDGLLVLFMTLAMVFTYKILKHGNKKNLLLPLAVLLVLGMATKAPFIVMVIISLVAVIIASIIHSKGSIRVKFLRGGLIALLIGFIVAIAVGWFYYLWNFVANGSWFTARPSGYTGGREVKSLVDVILSADLRRLLLTEYTFNPLLSIAIVSFVVAGFLNKTSASLIKAIKSNLHMVLLMTALFLGILATQIEHAVGVGSVNFRYMLPALLPIGLLLSLGLLEIRRTGHLLLGSLVILMGLTSILAKGKGSGIDGIFQASKENGITILAPLGLLMLFLVGSTILIVVLFITQKNQTEHSPTMPR